VATLKFTDVFGCHNSLAEITLSWQTNFPIGLPRDGIDAMTSLWCGHEHAVDGVIEFCPVQRFVDDAIRMAIGLRASGTVECILRRPCSKVMIELQMYSAGGILWMFSCGSQLVRVFRAPHSHQPSKHHISSARSRLRDTGQVIPRICGWTPGKIDLLAAGKVVAVRIYCTNYMASHRRSS
jgi:hypothetical protein